MSNRETSPEIASMAGRILQRGNMLDDMSVILALIEGIAESNSGAKAQEVVKRLLGPAFDDMLSLAGSALSQREDDDSQPLGENVIMVPLEVDYEKVANAFVGAIEGGYSGWMHQFYPATDDLSAKLKRGMQDSGGIWYAEGSYWRDGGAAVIRYDRPDEDEGKGGGEITVSQAEIKLGLGLMAKNAPKHFADLINENDDAITHDVFVQFVVLGEIVYG